MESGIEASSRASVSGKEQTKSPISASGWTAKFTATVFTNGKMEIDMRES